MRANRVWKAADRFALQQIQKITNKHIKLLLNGVQLSAMEWVTASTTKKDTPIRAFAKALIQFEFKSSNRLSYDKK